MKKGTICNRLSKQAGLLATQMRHLLKRIGIAVNIRIKPGRSYKYFLFLLFWILELHAVKSQTISFSNESISVEADFGLIDSNQICLSAFLKNTNTDTIWLATNSSYILEDNGNIMLYFGWDQKNPHEIFEASPLLPGDELFLSCSFEKREYMSIHILCSYINDYRCLTNKYISGNWHLICGKWAEFVATKL
ncbi:MAG: hypothetical protein IT262_05630 [Saprospiraceae bacterium]|nr:hypothetical protein [Saprospiraceae bacterium]